MFGIEQNVSFEPNYFVSFSDAHNKKQRKWRANFTKVLEVMVPLLLLSSPVGRALIQGMKDWAQFPCEEIWIYVSKRIALMIHTVRYPGVRCSHCMQPYIYNTFFPGVGIAMQVSHLLGQCLFIRLKSHMFIFPTSLWTNELWNKKWSGERPLQNTLLSCGSGSLLGGVRSWLSQLSDLGQADNGFEPKSPPTR